MASWETRAFGSFWRALLAVFIMVTCLRIWMGPMTLIETAHAQIPDSGLQRQLLLEEVRKTNQILSEIKQFLERHPFNVEKEGADNPARSAPSGRGGP